MRVSIRAYARHRGISDTAVRKDIKSGRITAELDGTINIGRADMQWQSNTNKRVNNTSHSQQHKHKAVPKAALDAVDQTLTENSDGKTTFIQARTAN